MRPNTFRSPGSNDDPRFLGSVIRSSWDPLKSNGYREGFPALVKFSEQQSIILSFIIIIIVYFCTTKTIIIATFNDYNH